MSWDISIQKFSRPYACVSDIGDDEKGLPLGSRLAVQAAVSAIFPSTNWADPAWGVWDAEFGSIEFSVGSDPAQSIALHVRAGPEVVPAIVQLCRDSGWQGIDYMTGEFIEQSALPEEGLIAWAAYRNRVIGNAR